MAKTSIYLPDDLAEQVRAHGISISEVVQRALRQAVQEAQITEKLMTDTQDVQAVVERLKLRRDQDAKSARAKAVAQAAQAREYGAQWARTMASAEEIELIATYDGSTDKFMTPMSLAMLAPRVRPGTVNWPDLQAAVREVWDQVKPLLIEIDEHGQNVPTGSGGFSEKVNPAYRLWELREPAVNAPGAEWDAYKAEEPDEFL